MLCVPSCSLATSVYLSPFAQSLAQPWATFATTSVIIGTAVIFQDFVLRCLIFDQVSLQESQNGPFPKDEKLSHQPPLQEC
jgi:hypothetical protein